MSNSVKSYQKITKPIKTSGRFATSEEAALTKNAKLVRQIEKIGLKIIKEKSKSW